MRVNHTPSEIFRVDLICSSVELDHLSELICRDILAVLYFEVDGNQKLSFEQRWIFVAGLSPIQHSFYKKKIV